MINRNNSCIWMRESLKGKETIKRLIETIVVFESFMAYKVERMSQINRNNSCIWIGVLCVFFQTPLLINRNNSCIWI